MKTRGDAKTANAMTTCGRVKASDAVTTSDGATTACKCATVVLGVALFFIAGAASAVHGQVLREVQPVDVGQKMPPDSFADQDGKRFSFTMLRGTPVVFAFIYTRCRDQRECPLISAKFGALQRLTKPNDLRLVEMTVDPVFDSPPILKIYARRFDADPRRWTLVTGDPDKVLDFAARFGVSAFAHPGADLIHSERTVIVDSAGIVRQLIDETAWSPGEIIAQVRADEHEVSNPIARLNLWLSSAAVAICGDSVAGLPGFADLLIFLAFVAALVWIFYRLSRAIRSAA